MATKTANATSDYKVYKISEKVQQPKYEFLCEKNDHGGLLFDVTRLVAATEVGYSYKINVISTTEPNTYRVDLSKIIEGNKYIVSRKAYLDLLKYERTKTEYEVKTLFDRGLDAISRSICKDMLDRNAISNGTKLLEDIALVTELTAMREEMRNADLVSS